ncbi:MAG TPA: rubredoxin [Bacteroidetes bacterium]|nr:rubredoxin [Bacteroidota bacterium]
MNIETLYKIMRSLCDMIGASYEDRKNRIAPVAYLENIPDDCECPVCEVSKSEFKPMEE